MKKPSLRCFVCLIFYLTVGVDKASAELPAFPGAEGFGAISVGGRGGDVYHVTSLQDVNSEGTLRHAVGTAPSAGRTIVFDISGNIHLSSSMTISRPNVTIAGQTAPGQGVTLSGGTLWLEDNDLIVRHIRTRLGANPAGGEDAISIQDGNRVIVDHSSASWSTDETSSVTRNSTNNTIQWSLITEPLNSQNHARSSLFRPGSNVPAGTPTEFNLSVHHSLYAHGSDRNPVLSTYNGHKLNIDFRNNVIFDWRNQATHTGDAGQFIDVNFVGNYYVAGLTTRADLVASPKIFSSGSTDTRIYYTTDNLVDATRDDGLANGVFLSSSIGGARTEVATPFDFPAVTNQTANDAYESVLTYAGSFWWNRDPVDDRVVTDVREISDPNPAVRAKSGMMLTTEADVGGLPVLPVVVRPMGWDVDADGLPGFWEIHHGLDPNTPDHNGDFDNDFYTNLEEYINEVGTFPSPAPIVFDGELNGRYARAENWSANWQPSRLDEVQINQGTTVMDAVGQHAGRLKIGTHPGDRATLSITDGWLMVENAGVGPGNGELTIGADVNATAALHLSGGRLDAETLTKGAGGSFSFTGGVLSANLVAFSLDVHGGTLAPPATTRVTQVVGDLTIDSGAIEIELEGTGPGEHDSLDVAGTVSLKGSLQIEPLSLYQDPTQAGSVDAFTIIRSQGVAGTFDEVVYNDELLDPTLITATESRSYVGDGLFRVVQYESENVVFTNYRALAGDANGDRVVDGADFIIWNAHKFLGETDWTTGDFNGDGVTDGADFILWNAHKFTSVDSAAAVPEPGSLILVVWVMIAFAVRRSF